MSNETILTAVSAADLLRMTPDTLLRKAREGKIPGGCWLWTQSLHPTGYGLFRCGSMSDGTRRREPKQRDLFERPAA